MNVKLLKTLEYNISKVDGHKIVQTVWTVRPGNRTLKVNVDEAELYR